MTGKTKQILLRIFVTVVILTVILESAWLLGVRPLGKGRGAHSQGAQAVSGEMFPPEIERMLADNDYVYLGYYLGHDGSVNLQDGAGRTLLFHAASQNRVDMLKLLLQYGADWKIPDRNHLTPLAAAAANGALDCVQLLIQVGAPVNETLFSGDTPLGLAARNGHTITTQYLLQQGAVTFPGAIRGDSALLRAARGGHEETALVLLAGGASVNDRMPDGSTILHIAAEKNLPKLAEAALQRKLDASLRNDAGLSALDIAGMYQNERLIDLLEQD